MTGSITAAWKMTCGGCETTRELPEAHATRASALSAANSIGWHYRTKRGWLCPVCWHQGDNMEIICDLFDLAEMLEGVRLALMSPPRAGNRLRDVRDYICAHCAEKNNGNGRSRCTTCQIPEKNS